MDLQRSQRERILDDSFAALRMVRLELDGLGAPESDRALETPVGRFDPLPGVLAGGRKRL